MSPRWIHAVEPARQCIRNSGLTFCMRTSWRNADVLYVDLVHRKERK